MEYRYRLYAPKGALRINVNIRPARLAAVKRVAEEQGQTLEEFVWEAFVRGEVAHKQDLVDYDDNGLPEG